MEKFSGGQKTGGRRRGSKNKIKPPQDVIRKVEAEAVASIATGESPLAYMLRVMRDPTVEDPRRDEMARAAAPYVHAKISPENTKTTESLHITLAHLVLGSYELEAAEKAKQIEGQAGKQAPAE